MGSWVKQVLRGGVGEWKLKSWGVPGSLVLAKGEGGGGLGFRSN